MNKKFYPFILLLFFKVGSGQNLVINGDFESNTGCPNYTAQLYLASQWINPSANATPDYFNQCDNSGNAGVPVNLGGYQYAHAGSAYGGVYLWHILSEYREYMEGTLVEPLLTGNCYFFKLYVNLANMCEFTTDEIGVYFSDTVVSGVSY